MSRHQTEYNFGYTVLGPIFHSYCWKLHGVKLFYDRIGDYKFLFLARGGLRLKYFYELLALEHSENRSSHLFVSRIAVFKAGLSILDSYCISQIAKEFKYFDFYDALSALIGTERFACWKNQLPAKKDDFFSKSKMSEKNLTEVLTDRIENAIILSYFSEQYELLLLHLNLQTNDSENIVLVDTGWGGSIPTALSRIFPIKNFFTIFFGRSSYGGKYQEPEFHNILGLELDAQSYDPFKKETAFLLHRHLIEGVCEPNCDSVTEYSFNQNELFFGKCDFNEFNVLPNKNEFLANGIGTYLLDNDGLSITDVFSKANNAYNILHKAIVFPSKKDLFLGNFQRSIDSGKQGDVDVLSKKAIGHLNFKRKYKNLKNSLWRNGQIVIEFPNIYKLLHMLLYFRSLLRSLKRRFYH